MSAILPIDSPTVAIDRERLAEFCRKWKVRELALFGSVLREDFRPDSDVDVLVEFAPDTHWTLFDLGEMQEDLTGIFGREVDLLSRRGVEMSRNPFRRKAILSSARTIYVSGS